MMKLWDGFTCELILHIKLVDYRNPLKGHCNIMTLISKYRSIAQILCLEPAKEYLTELSKRNHKNHLTIPILYGHANNKEFDSSITAYKRKFPLSSNTALGGGAVSAVANSFSTASRLCKEDQTQV